MWQPRDSQRVRSWTCAAKREAPDIPLAVVLSLIHVESAGDPRAKRPGSQFHGLLQMGRMAGIDVGFKDVGTRTTEALHGNGDLAIQSFAKYQERYAERTKGEPRRMALLWKAGPGFLSSVNRRTANGVEWLAAVEDVGKSKGFSAIEYLRRFEACMEIYDAEHD